MGYQSVKTMVAAIGGQQAEPFISTGEYIATPDNMNDERIQMLAIGMRLKGEIDANIKTLAGDTTYSNEDRALLAGVSAAVLSDENVKKMSVE